MRNLNARPAVVIELIYRTTGAAPVRARCDTLLPCPPCLRATSLSASSLSGRCTMDRSTLYFRFSLIWLTLLLATGLALVLFT